ncbi:hypothetical protein Pfo_005140 [Paulownia fortunei]|nr:hypothetical protein Pfo_005140 [Paulownia fortunei]
MVEPSSISNPDTNSNASRKKRRKIGPDSPVRAPAEPCITRWRTETEQQIYSSKLVDELRHLRRPDSADATVRTVRDAADRVLAVSAKGRTRWSRAILTRRLSLRLSQIKKKHKRAARPDAGIKKPAVQKKLPPLQRKVRVLSRLVPGCGKLSLPNLLEETTDYIAALEMQVKAMTFISGLLNGGGPGVVGGGFLAD